MAGERLRILHTESSLGWGGQEIRILTEARGFIDRGHHVVLACPTEARIFGEAQRRGIEAVGLPIGRKRLSNLFALRAWLRSSSREFDVINTHSSTDAWLSVLACIGLRAPPAIVRTRHLSTSVDRSFATRWLYVGGTRIVVTTGERIRQQLFHRNGYPLSRMISVPTGIDLARFRPGDPREARASLGLPERKTLGIVATLRGWKGHADLLDAWGTVAAKFPEWQLVIVGDGPQRESLQRRIKEEALFDRVYMVGNRDDVETWFAALDLFVLPSWGNEGVPQAILQAMATGLPVVSTTVGAIDEAVSHGETGLLVQPRDVPALAASIGRLMADGALRGRLGSAGLARARAHFGIEAMIDRMQSIFESAAAGGPGTPRLHISPPLHLAFPYNEILPKRSAHDVYVFTTAVAAARAGAQASLLVGRGGPREEELHSHYRTVPPATFHVFKLPIVRRNFRLRVTLNAVFDRAALAWLRRHQPDWLVTSVLKQGHFHATHRVPGVRHIHEVHELAWYPGRDASEPFVRRRIEMERSLYSRVDAIAVTTHALEAILRSPPYAIATPVIALPLCAPEPMPLQAPDDDGGNLVRLAYVGQLYHDQGVALLVEALARVPQLELDVVGGRPEEVDKLRALANSVGVSERIVWHGFVSPAEIALRIGRADAFVAPFLDTGRMPYVAHTKLAEYRAWRRPIVAPDLSVVHEHLANAGLLTFQAGSVESLSSALRELTDAETRRRLMAEAARAPGAPDALKRAQILLHSLAEFSR